jgi:hypothetical protein
MKKKSVPLGKVYGLLEPGPVVLLTTSRKGRPNVMAVSWHTMWNSNRRWSAASSAFAISASPRSRRRENA